MKCCSNPQLVRRTNDCIALLKEPPRAVRLFGHRCTNCKRLSVSPADVAYNQRAALRVAAEVSVSPSMWRELFR